MSRYGVFSLAAWIIIFLGNAGVHGAVTDAIDFDSNGLVHAAVDWPRETPMHAGLWIVGDGWKTIVRQETLRDLKRTPGDAGATWNGVAGLGSTHIDVQQIATGTRIEYRCKSDADVSLEGIYWFASLPISRFAGGSVNASDQSIALRAVAATSPQQMGSLTGDRVTIRSADGKVSITLTFDAAKTIRVQDATRFGETSFQISVPAIEGQMKRGEESKLIIDLATKLEADTSDATITVDANAVQGDFDGFGGNFVYGSDSPVTRATLDALKLTWARVPMELREWMPTKDGGVATDAVTTDAASGTKLRKRFELDQELSKRTDGRLIASIWYLPEWLFAEPMNTEWRESAGIVPRERWDLLADCIATYLVHLRDVYGVEPRYFSFNESDIGVYVKLDADSMHDLTRVIAARFARSNLKTRLLLGDSADLALGLDQVAPTLADEQTRAFVGALSYHPWAGQNDRWPTWAALAEKNKLPLFTTEMGADADAWRDGSYASPRYALRLAERYIEQLSTSHSRALLEWEWSDDFPLATRSKSGTYDLSPRGQWLKQITQRTPQFARVVKTTSDNPTVMAATVIRDKSWAIHIVNLDAARVIHLHGLPSVMTMTLSLTDPEAGATPDQTLKVDAAGTCDLKLNPAALATLSTPGVSTSGGK